jgi:hypothetical protein
MISQERRKSPRIAVDRLAYINIEPDNGGVVLNVSSGGLSFQSVAPVERNRPLRFSLSEYKRSITACGELVWTDEVRTSGGLRFTTLTSSEARNQLSDWLKHAVGLDEMKPSTSPIREDRAPTPVPPFLFEEDCASLPSVLPVQDDKAVKAIVSFAVQQDSVASPVVSPVRAEPAKPRFSLLSARGLLANSKASMTGSGAASAIVGGVRTVTAATKPGGFSAGFAIGLLISAIAFFISTLGYVHRFELRESLVRFGHRLVVHREAQTPSQFHTPPLIVPPVEFSKTQTAIPAAPQTVDVQVPDDEVTVRHLARTDPSVESKASPPQPSQSAPHPASAQRVRVANTEGAAVAPPAMALRAQGPPTFLFDHSVNVVPQRFLASAAAADPGSLRLQMYFDLGKFKDELLAKTVRDRIANQGLRTTVLERKILWKNSYQVLVGPYSNKEDETRIENELQSQGYKPRPFERGSRDFAFGSHLSLNGSSMPFGGCTISWESHVSEAKVKFEQGRGVIATADAKWLQLPRKYSRDEYVYVRNPDGSKTLVEIRFSGLDRALVFRHTS